MAEISIPNVAFLVAGLLALPTGRASAQETPVTPSNGATVTSPAVPVPSYDSGPPSVLTPQQEQAGRLRWKRCHRNPDPKAPVEVGQPTVIGLLSAEDVEGRVVTILEELRCCYGVEVEDDPTLSVRMVVKILTNASGTTAGATIRSTTVQRPRLEACVAESFRHLVLPSVVGSESTVAMVPLLLSPGR